MALISPNSIATIFGFDTPVIPPSIETRTTKRTKRLRLTVYPGGRVVVSRPRFVTDRGVVKFLKSHEAWLFREVERMRAVTVPEGRMQGSRREYLAKKEEARALVAERLAHWNERYHFTFGRFAIKNMSSRWGSCSAKKNLNFHYKIVELPKDLADYLIVHELCHLKEMNHGPQFWALVAREIPEYEALRRRLRAFYR